MMFTKHRNCYTPIHPHPALSHEGEETLGGTLLPLLALALGFIGTVLLAGGLG